MPRGAAAALLPHQADPGGNPGVPGVGARLPSVSGLRRLNYQSLAGPQPGDRAARRGAAPSSRLEADGRSGGRVSAQRGDWPNRPSGSSTSQQRARRFLLRGLAGVAAEWTVLATAFNLGMLWRAWRSSSPKQWTGGPEPQPAGRTASPPTPPGFNSLRSDRAGAFPRATGQSSSRTLSVQIRTVHSVSGPSGFLRQAQMAGTFPALCDTRWDRGTAAVASSDCACRVAPCSPLVNGGSRL